MREALTILIALVGLAGRAEAAGWRGPWKVDGGAGWRHVGGPDDALVLEGRFAGLDAALRGAGDGRGFSLTGAMSGAVGERWVERPARLAARAVGQDALEVTLDIDGAAPVRERWSRPRAPRVRVEVGRRGRSAEEPLRHDPASGDLTFDVIVEGRALPIVVMIVAAADDARYAPLGGIVHHEALALGEPLPVGRHRVAWSGRDRGVSGRAVLPGEYRLVVMSGEDTLGPPPGEESAGLLASLPLTVEGGAGAPASPPAPTVASPVVDDDGPGLTGAVKPRAAVRR